MDHFDKKEAENNIKGNGLLPQPNNKIPTLDLNHSQTPDKRVQENHNSQQQSPQTPTAQQQIIQQTANNADDRQR